MRTTTAAPTCCASTTTPGSCSARSGSSLSRDLELLAAYRAATWSVRWQGRSLRLTATAPPPAELGALALVTAYNPASTHATTEANRSAMRELLRRAAASGVPWRPARGHGAGAQAERWAEPSLALLGPRAEEAARELGAAFRQNAVLIARPGEHPRLLVTRPGFCGQPLGTIL